MTHAQKKSLPRKAEGIEDPEGCPQEQINPTAAPIRGALRESPSLAEPLPGRALAIRTAKTDGDLARACLRYAAARMMVRAMRGQAPDNACEVVAGSVAEHVRHCAVLPKPSRRQMARAVEVAFAAVERGA